MKPKFNKQIGKNNKIYFSGKFNTYTFSSLKWFYDLFYLNHDIKDLPTNIKEF
jgi:hypothetical protein